MSGSPQEVQSIVREHQVQVRWSDFDRYGHMMNANYIEIAQEARLLFAKETFYSKGIEFASFVRHLTVDFRAPITGSDIVALKVETEIVAMGETSFTTRQRIFDQHGNVSCVVDCVQVTVDMKTGRPRPVTEEERAILLNGHA